MTDEHMDARLRTAGERWRSANESPAGVDVAATVAAHEPHDVSPAPRRPRHWGLLASAALIAAALAVGGTLALRGGGGTSPRPGADNAGLVGTVWELVGYEKANPPSQSPPGPPPPLQLRDGSNATLYIDRDGQLVADDSCAVIGAKAHAAAGELTVTDQVVRYRSCTDTVGDMVFTTGDTTVLDGTSSYEITGDTMTISRAGTTMHFVAGPDDPAPSLDVPTFVGAHWTLVKAVDAGGTDVPVQAVVPFFVADDGSLTAGDGCNTLTGTVTGIGQVRFENVGGTEIGCPPLQLTIHAVLDGQADESVLGATLTLRKAGAGELTYQWVPADKAASDPQALVGKTWRLHSSVGEPAASDAQLMIHGTTYTANDGCREFTGHVAVEPGTLDFTGVPSDNPPCGGSGAEQASTMDSFLNTGGLWAIRDGSLVIWDAASGQQFSLVFITASTPPPTVTNPTDELFGKTWYLSYVEPDVGGTGPVYQVTVPVTLIFDPSGAVRLADRCDDADGTVRITEQTVDFVDMRGETHSCPSGPALSNSEHEVVSQVLNGTTTWRLEGHQVTFTNGNNALVFKDQAPISLLGSRWKMTSFQYHNPAGTSGGGGASADTTHGPHLSIENDGTFTTDGGCTPLRGQVDVGTATLTFRDVVPIGGHCIDSYSDREHAFDTIFEGGTATFDLTDGQLTLSRGGAVLHFVRG